MITECVATPTAQLCINVILWLNMVYLYHVVTDHWPV